MKCEVPDGPGATLPWPTRLTVLDRELTFLSADTHHAIYRDQRGEEIRVHPYSNLGSLGDRRPFRADLEVENGEPGELCWCAHETEIVDGECQFCGRLVAPPEACP